jgi:hypothetical protein
MRDGKSSRVALPLVSQGLLVRREVLVMLMPSVSPADSPPMSSRRRVPLPYLPSLWRAGPARQARAGAGGRYGPRGPSGPRWLGEPRMISGRAGVAGRPSVELGFSLL